MLYKRITNNKSPKLAVKHDGMPQQKEKMGFEFVKQSLNECHLEGEMEFGYAKAELL